MIRHVRRLPSARSRLFILLAMSLLAGCAPLEPTSPPKPLPGDVDGCRSQPFPIPATLPDDHVTVVLRVKHEIKFARPTGLCVVVDGKRVASRSPDATVDDLTQAVDFPVVVRAGSEHVASVVVRVRGETSSYLRGYRFELKSSHAFRAAKAGTLEVVTYEGGSSDTPLEQRPNIRWTDHLGGAEAGVPPPCQ